MKLEQMKKIVDGAPDGATHHWTNQWGTAYYCYCEQINRWLHYDKYHDHWTCQKMHNFIDKLKPL